MFPSPPLKFRTTGFPQYGFKWDVKHDLRHRTTYTCPKPRSLALWLLRACRRAAVQWPSHPEALRSAVGYAVPPPQPLLWPHLRLSEPPADLCLRRRVFAYRPAPRRSPLYSTCVCQRAAFRTPVDRAGALGCCFPARSSFHLLCTGSASTSPHTSVLVRLRFEAAKFALCCGPSTGLPFTDKDVYARAFTSGVASQRCRV